MSIMICALVNFPLISVYRTQKKKCILHLKEKKFLATSISTFLNQGMEVAPKFQFSWQLLAD